MKQMSQFVLSAGLREEAVEEQWRTAVKMASPSSKSDHSPSCNAIQTRPFTVLPPPISPAWGDSGSSRQTCVLSFSFGNRTRGAAAMCSPLKATYFSSISAQRGQEPQRCPVSVSIMCWEFGDCISEEDIAAWDPITWQTSRAALLLLLELRQGADMFKPLRVDFRDCSPDIQKLDPLLLVHPSTLSVSLTPTPTEGSSQEFFLWQQRHCR